MKRACLLIAVPALLVALGFAQTPTPSSNTDSTSIKGCLGGSDGNYTLVEDNTGRNFKLTTSVDLKPHLGHDVTLVGQKATAGAADGSFAVTSVNMISEHCAAAAAAPAGSISTPPADTATPPPAAAAVPAATIPAPTDTSTAPAAASAAPAATVATATSAVAAAAPAATVPPAADTASAPTAAASVAPSTASPAEPVVTPNVAVPAASATVQTTVDTASAPPSATTTADATARTDAVVVPNAATTHRTRVPAEHVRAKATVAAAAPPAETATPVADAAKPPAADSAPSETPVTPDAAVTTPAVTAKKGFPGLWIAMAVVVLILGTLVPLINRWRKRRLLAQSDKQNLSFSHRATSESGNGDKPVTPRKAA